MNNGSQGPATKETPLDFPCKCVCHKVGLEGFQCCPCTIKLQAGLLCAKCGRPLQGHYCYFNSPENSTFSFKTSEPQTCQAPAQPASSQGPAREETPQSISDVANECQCNHSAIEDCDSRPVHIGKFYKSAFDAGAKSVVAAPQLEKENTEMNQKMCQESDCKELRTEYQKLVSALADRSRHIAQGGDPEQFVDAVINNLDEVEAVLPDAMNRRLVERIKLLLDRANREAALAVKLRQQVESALAGAAALLSPENEHRLKLQLQVAHNVLLTQYGQKCGLDRKCDVCLEVEALMASPPVPSKEPK